MSVRVKVTGKSNFINYKNSLPKRTMNGLKKAMEKIYDTSQTLVPVDTGKLKRSGKIRELKQGYTIRYSAVNPKNKYDYSSIQHENLHFKHRVGQAKYLSEAVRKNRIRIRNIVIKEVLK